jgi:hypothetical protein
MSEEDNEDDILLTRPDKVKKFFEQDLFPKSDEKRVIVKCNELALGFRYD